MNEFGAIEKYFAPLSLDGLKDDAAVLEISAGHELVVTSDTLNEFTHFPEDENPQLIAHKALRVNLSDLAAMGAEPFAYQLNLALSEHIDELWLASFVKGLKKDQESYKIKLSGGDTTGTKGPLSVSITAMGLVPAGKAVRRGGAKAGDAIVLTGPVGDAWLGLEVLLGHFNIPSQEKVLERYRLPQPRNNLAALVREYAHAAIDVSDGLIADLGHICEASHVAAEAWIEKITFSESAAGLLAAGKVTPEQLLSGGDDYELLLAIEPGRVDEFCRKAAALGVRPQLIGAFSAGAGVRLIDASGAVKTPGRAGYTHF